MACRSPSHLGFKIIDLEVRLCALPLFHCREDRMRRQYAKGFVNSQTFTNGRCSFWRIVSPWGQEGAQGASVPPLASLTGQVCSSGPARSPLPNLAMAPLLSARLAALVL